MEVSLLYSKSPDFWGRESLPYRFGLILLAKLNEIDLWSDVLDYRGNKRAVCLILK